MKSSISPYKLLYNESKVKFWHKRKVWDKFYYAIILYYICYFCSVLVSNNRTDQQWSPRDLRAMFYFSCVSTRKKNDLMMMSQTLSCFLLFTFIWYVLTRLNNTKSRLKNDFTGEILILNFRENETEKHNDCLFVCKYFSWKWQRFVMWKELLAVINPPRIITRVCGNSSCVQSYRAF